MAPWQAMHRRRPWTPWSSSPVGRSNDYHTLVADSSHRDPPGGEPGADFVRTAVRDDLASGRFARVQTRWPPEPSGYPNIGHAKAALLNADVAAEFDGSCTLRFDDTNPDKETSEYAEAIKEDVKWLGFDWEERLFHASDYFDQLHDWAVKLIKDGKAYVCDSSPEEMRKARGNLTMPGQNSPNRDRDPEERHRQLHLRVPVEEVVEPAHHE